MSGIPSITPEEFCRRWPDFALGTAVILLDVREPHELGIAAIEGTLNIPMALVPSHAEELDANRTIVVMCHGGVRSMRVAGYLAQRGFTDVINLEGGIDAWSCQVDPRIPRY